MVLAPFAPVVTALVTFALALMATFLILKVMESLGGVPVIGGYVVSWAERISKAISNACGHLFAGVEHLVGGGLHQMSVYLNETWGVLRKGNAALAHVAKVVGDTLYHVTGLRALVRSVTKLAHTIAHRFVTIGREIYRLDKRVKHLAHQVAVGIGDDILPRLKSLDKELTDLKQRVIPGVRGIAQEAEDDVAALRTWVTDNVPLLGTTALVGAVAWALSALGLGGLRCNSLRNNMDKRGCSMWGAMDDLLGLVALGIVAAEFETLVHEAQEVTEFSVSAFDEVFGLSR